MNNERDFRLPPLKVPTGMPGSLNSSLSAWQTPTTLTVVKQRHSPQCHNVDFPSLVGNNNPHVNKVKRVCLVE